MAGALSSDDVVAARTWFHNVTRDGENQPGVNAMRALMEMMVPDETRRPGQTQSISGRAIRTRRAGEDMREMGFTAPSISMAHLGPDGQRLPLSFAPTATFETQGASIHICHPTGSLASPESQKSTDQHEDLMQFTDPGDATPTKVLPHPSMPVSPKDITERLHDVSSAQQLSLQLRSAFACAGAWDACVICTVQIFGFWTDCGRRTSCLRRSMVL